MKEDDTVEDQATLHSDAGHPFTTASTDTVNAARESEVVAVRSSGESAYAYGPAFERLVDYANEELTAVGVPGMTFCLVDAEGLTAVGNLGMADVDRQIPVSHSHLFEIGSISKSFAALCVYRLADEGKVDLDAPLSRYLPDAPLPAEPVRVQQILSHTAGLPTGTPAALPRVPDQRLWTGFRPGTSYSYSDTGYDLIGMMIEAICNMPYPLALRELVIEPLGITGMREVIQPSERALYAVGYSPLDASGPSMIQTPLGQAPWVNWDNAAGNVAATADAIAPYLRYLIAVGRGQGAPLISNSAAKRFTTPTEPAANGYASGLSVIDLGGRSVLHHDGTMAGFTSVLTVDPMSGVGCFVSTNVRLAGYRPSNISEYACRLLRHAREGGTPPSVPDASALNRIHRAADYAGTYIAPGGDSFELVERTGRLFLLADGSEGRVQTSEGNGFQTDNPSFRAHPLVFEHDGGPVRAAWFGDVLYGRGAPMPQPAVPLELAALQGCYMSEDPRMGQALIVAHGDRLILERSTSADPLVREGDYWRLESCERVRFLNFQNGVPRCLNISGRPDFWRFNSVD